MPETQAIFSYEALMALSEDQIRELFPNGASTDGKKWQPADSKPDRSLTRLLRDKKARRDIPRLLHRDSTHGYTDVPALALNNEPEAVDEASQRKISLDAHDDFQSSRTTTDLVRVQGERDGLRAKLRAYRYMAEERGQDIDSDLRVIERRLSVLDKKLGVT